MARLKPDEKAMVDRVIKIVKEKNVEMRKAIGWVLGEVKDEARRTYLWNTLTKAARAKIRRQAQKQVVTR